MPNHAADIKSMKLYSHIERVYNELAELGKTGNSPLSAPELSAFDQLHYHGTDAVDTAINILGIKRNTRVLEIGSGFGGPARHIAHTTQAQVTALELQPDQHKLAAELTARCNLANNLTHLCGDFLTHDWRGEKFDAIVSWLALYHIPDRPRVLAITAELLPPGGAFYAEDLFSRQPFTEQERAQLATGLYAAHLPDLDTYQTELQQAGFTLEQVDDMSNDWTQFTTARLHTYQSTRDRHLRVHGAPTYHAMEEFYQLVTRYFRSGKLGGVRVVGRRG